MHEEAKDASERIVKSLSAKKLKLSAAESCTGGMAAALLVGVSGASKVFWGSFVSYAEDAKIKMLGVPEEIIKKHGVVSRETAVAMAKGAVKKSGADLAFSVTGFAGPIADDPKNPVGTVWIATAEREGSGNFETDAKMFLFDGDRNDVREKAAIAALEMLWEKLNV